MHVRSRSGLSASAILPVVARVFASVRIATVVLYVARHATLNCCGCVRPLSYVLSAAVRRFLFFTYSELKSVFFLLSYYN